MIVMMFITFIIITSVSFFCVVVKYNTVNRIVVFSPMEIAELSIPLVGDEDLYFNKTKLEKGFKDYYDSNLIPVVEEYSLYFYYYNQDDFSICTNGLCNAIEVTVDCDIAFTFKYHRTMYYEIRNVSHE